ncbi:hypothetical protein ACU8KH_05952 [Lachancea thermotolerans]
MTRLARVLTNQIRRFRKVLKERVEIGNFSSTTSGTGFSVGSTFSLLVGLEFIRNIGLVTHLESSFHLNHCDREKPIQRERRTLA